MSDPCTAATALLSFKMADRCEKYANDAATLQCSNDLCKLPIVKQTSFPAMRHAPNQTLPMGCWELGKSAEAVPSLRTGVASEDEEEAYKLETL